MLFPEFLLYRSRANKQTGEFYTSAYATFSECYRGQLEQSSLGSNSKMHAGKHVDMKAYVHKTKHFCASYMGHYCFIIPHHVLLHLTVQGNMKKHLTSFTLTDMFLWLNLNTAIINSSLWTRMGCSMVRQPVEHSLQTHLIILCP